MAWCPSTSCIAGYTPLLSLGYKRTIQMEDEFGLPHHLETANTYPTFAARLRNRMEASKQTEKVLHACSGSGLLPCVSHAPDWGTQHSLPPLQGRQKFERTEAGKIAPHLWASLLTQHGGWLFASIALQGIYNAFNFRCTFSTCSASMMCYQ